MENLYVFAVVPHAGTWIEIWIMMRITGAGTVVPHAGTWIEITNTESDETRLEGRSPRGNVD